MRLWVDSLKRGTSIVKKAMEFRFGQGESPQSLRFPLIQRRRKSMLKQKSSTAPSHNCPQQTTAHNNALTKYSLTEDQTRYLPTKADVKNFLEETYHREYKLEDITVSLCRCSKPAIAVRFHTAPQLLTRSSLGVAGGVSTLNVR